MKIAVLPGDGIGKEVTRQAVKCLHAVLGDKPRPTDGSARSAALDMKRRATLCRAATLELARQSDAILLGGAGVLEDESRPPEKAAGRGLLRLRKELGLFANFRPAFLFPELAGASTLKPEIVDGLDIIILRELNGDVYYGQPRGFETSASGERSGFNTMRYSESEVERIGRVAFETARRRHGKVCSVDKANVLETSALWREVMVRLGPEYPDVELSHLYVDAAAMALMRNPKQFDVIVTGNIFGDILSDAAAMLTGSIGMLPSASMGTGRKGLFEPVHGTAPDIAGKDVANPLASILSMAMMLRQSFDLRDQSERVEKAVRNVLQAGYRTADIFETGLKRVGTEEMGDLVASAIGPAIN